MATLNVTAAEIDNAVELGASRAAKINSDFSEKVDGAITTTDTGETLTLTTNAGTGAQLEILNGLVTNTATGAESAAGHMMILGMTENTRRIGCEFEFTETGTTDEGGVALVLWSEHLVYPGPVVDTEMHITYTNKVWNIGQFTNGTYTSYATGTYLNELVQGVTYRVEVAIEGFDMYVLLPDGNVVRVNNPNINRVATAIPSWEIYESNAATDWKAGISSIWADNYAQTTYGGTPSKSDVYSSILDIATSLIPKAAEYPSPEQGNLAVGVPDTATALSSDLDIEFIAPPSGKVLVEFNARFDVTASGIVTWTLLINEAGYSNFRNLTPAATGLNTNFITAMFLVDGLNPGQRYTTNWLHEKTGGTATLRLNGSGGQPATAKVTPLG